MGVVPSLSPCQALHRPIPRIKVKLLENSLFLIFIIFIRMLIQWLDYLVYLFRRIFIWIFSRFLWVWLLFDALVVEHFSVDNIVKVIDCFWLGWAFFGGARSKELFNQRLRARFFPLCGIFCRFRIHFLIRTGRPSYFPLLILSWSSCLYWHSIRLLNF